MYWRTALFADFAGKASCQTLRKCLTAIFYNMMNGSPRLLLWNYTEEEKARVDRLLADVNAPPAVAIRKDQGYLPISDIVTDTRGEQDFECDEKLVLFYNIPNKGISFLIDLSKKRNLPQPIYAAVTEHSIHWPLNELMEELIAEREAFKQAQQEERQE